jgi:histone deacetylase 11
MIKTKIHVSHGDDDNSYFRKLTSNLPNVIENFSPDFIIYNAGTDCMKNDPLGGMNLSPEMIIRRDQLIFHYALEKYNVPIVMVLSGGY